VLLATVSGIAVVAASVVVPNTAPGSGVVVAAAVSSAGLVSTIVGGVVDASWAKAVATGESKKDTVRRLVSSFVPGPMCLCPITPLA